MKKTVSMLLTLLLLFSALTIVPLVSAEPSVTGMSQDAESITIQNELAKYVISKSTANVTSIVSKASNADIKNTDIASPFCYFYVSSITSGVNPVSAQIANGKLQFSFTGGVVLDFIVRAEPKYISFELDSEIPGNYKGLPVIGAFHLANERIQRARRGSLVDSRIRYELLLWRIPQSPLKRY